MEELFNGQLSFADIDAEKFLHVRRAHADRRVNAMDRLTDDVINELIQLCLPHYHIKAGETVQQGRPYTRLETMVRVHLLQVSLNLSDPEMESYLASDMVAHNFCRVSSTRLFISDSTILRFRHFIEQHGLAQKFLERTVNMVAEAGACSFDVVAADGTFIEAPSSTKNKAHARDPEMASSGTCCSSRGRAQAPEEAHARLRQEQGGRVRAAFPVLGNRSVAHAWRRGSRVRSWFATA